MVKAQKQRQPMTFRHLFLYLNFQVYTFIYTDCGWYSCKKLQQCYFLFLLHKNRLMCDGNGIINQTIEQKLVLFYFLLPQPCENNSNIFCRFQMKEIPECFACLASLLVVNSSSQSFILFGLHFIQRNDFFLYA